MLNIIYQIIVIYFIDSFFITCHNALKKNNQKTGEEIIVTMATIVTILEVCWKCTHIHVHTHTLSGPSVDTQ